VARCVGRTIADLEGAELIDTPHVARALQYRKREGDSTKDLPPMYTSHHAA